jgi:hypothetical protein
LQEDSLQFFKELRTDSAVFNVYLKKVRYNTSDDDVGIGRLAPLIRGTSYESHPRAGRAQFYLNTPASIESVYSSAEKVFTPLYVKVHLGSGFNYDAYFIINDYFEFILHTGSAFDPSTDSQSNHFALFPRGCKFHSS